MDCFLSEEELEIRSVARKFAEAELAPCSAKLDETADYSILTRNLQQLAQLGFSGLAIPAEYGGCEAGCVAYSLALTELGKQCAATTLTVSVTNMVAEVINSIGTSEQKNQYLPKICSGEYLAASFCLTESGAGSDPAAMKTRATPCGSGKWKINGTKQWITSAPFAGVFVVWAVTDPAAPRGKGISCFLVDAATPGVTVGPAQKKMGQHGSPTCDVHFDDVVVLRANLLGEENNGFRLAVAELAGGRIGIASLALGIGLAALHQALEYSKQREQFGKKLHDFQALQWMLADSATELEAARLLIFQAATKKKRREPFAKEASMAKLFATECANRVCYAALQIHGGYGYMKDFPVERLSRDARITTIYEGTSEIQRIIIARELLKSL